MARQECVQAMTAAMGRQPTQKELQDIEGRIRANLRALAVKDPVSAMGRTPAQRLEAAAKMAATQLQAEAVKAQQRVALQILARQRVQDYISAHPGDAMSAIDDLVAFNARSRPGAISVETRARAIARDAERQLLSLWELGGDKMLGLFQDRTGVEAIIRELHGEDTGRAEVKEAVKAWRDVTEAMRRSFNDAGGDIGRLADWGMPHHHSADRVGRAGGPQWIADVLPLLDRNRYRNQDGSRMSDEALRGVLTEAWAAIATRGASDIEPGKVVSAAMRAKRNAEHRQLHFKDAQSFLAYQRAYGEKGLFDLLTGHIRNLARDTALVETFGPNPDAAVAYFLDTAERDASTAAPLESGKIRERRQSIERLYNLVAGNVEPVADRRLAEWSSTLKNLLVSSRLGSAVVSSIGDESTMMLTSRVNGLKYAQVLRNELAALNPANQTELRIARRAGLALDTLLGSLGRFGDEQLGSFGRPSAVAAERTGRLANAVMRAQGLSAITEARQRAFGMTMMDSIGALVQSKPFAKLDEGDGRILASKGVTATDWAIWKKAKPETLGANHTLLTPDSIAAVSDADVAKVIGSKDPLAIRQARRDALLRLLGAVTEEVDMAVINPGARDQERTTWGFQRGTKRGELVRSIFLFKSFPLAVIARHWGRAASLGGGARAGYIAALLATTTVLGALAVQISEMLNGRDPRDMSEGKFWVASLLKGGSLGIYGDFLFSQASQHGGSATASLLGPAIGLLEEAGNLTQGNLIELMQGDDPKWQAEAIKFLKGITPGTSLWYSKAAMDHLIFQQMQEHFSPGYLNRVKSRARREFGQEYWWEPGDATPDRGPDFDRALGQ